MQRHRITAIFTLLIAPVFAHASGDSIHASGFDPDAGFQSIRIPDRNDSVACSGRTNQSARIGPVFLAQSHFLEPTHPFFHLNARRPILVKANVTGSGNSPEVKVTAKINGEVIGTLCLAGPATLPTTVDAGTQSRTNSFTATLPAAWVRQGLALSIATSGQNRDFDTQALRVGPEPVLTLFVQDLYLFGATVPSARADDWARRYLASLPLSGLQVTSLTSIHSQRLSIEPRDDGRDRFGTNGRQPATMATRNPSCTSSEASSGNCTTYSGFAVLNSVRHIIGTFLNANGANRFAQTYGLLASTNHVGGGLAGGGVGSGDDLDVTFNHEMGHSANMPHWGRDWYGRTDSTANQRFPYSGEYGALPSNPTGGGFGNTWGYDMLGDRIIAPICAISNKERQDPLQRSGPACLESGQLYDHLSDYSALFTSRFFVGTPDVFTGTIPYPRDPIGNASAVPFAMPAQGGKIVIEAPNSSRPLLTKWNSSQARYVTETVPNIELNELIHVYPEKYNVKVVTFWGSYSNTTPESIMISEPVRYIGNLKKTWNPSDPVDFASIKSWVSGEGFWWGADLVLRVDYANGTHRSAVMKVAPRSNDPLNGGSFGYWAVNFPDDNEVISATLYHRPMEVRYPGTVTPNNINQTGNPTTSENYLDTARIVATYP